MRANSLLSASLGIVALVNLTACDAMVDRSKASASVTSRAFSDATQVWTDVFTYHPPKPPQKPQTRYCYKQSTDIVCYDSVQPQLTSRLFGYQDGDQMSWIQPGGGSLGASGGNPVALQPVEYDNQASLDDKQTLIIERKTPIQHTAVKETGKIGEIQTIDIPPPH